MYNVIKGVQQTVIDSLIVHVSDSIPEAHHVKRRLGSSVTAALKPHGVKYVPVVLVEFADKTFSVRENDEDLRAYYDLYCNGTRDGELYQGHGSRGSIRDYFVEQSEGEFLPEFGIIGPVRLDNSYSYYGADEYVAKTIKTPDGRDSTIMVLNKHDKNFNKFCDDAVKKAVAIGTDWNHYDNDGNGSIDMVFFIYAGFGQNSGGDEDTIWPRETQKSSTINNKQFGCSACCCELLPVHDKDGNLVREVPDGIGVFIHELSHAMGLPDFYDTNYVAFGMDLWSVMDYGEYGNSGYNPGNYTAYERDFMGWRPLIEINDPCTLTIPCFAEGGNGYKIVNDANANEYYVIENRQSLGWDDYIGRCCTGLQVTHVDYSSALWTQNTVNTNASHQRMTIIAANDDYRGSNTDVNIFSNADYLAVLSGHLYPGSNDIHEVWKDPVYKGGRMNKPICAIEENEDRTVTLKFRPLGTLAQAANLHEDEMGDDYFVACWDEVENADCYHVELWAEGEMVERCDSVAACQMRFEGLKPNIAYQFRVEPLNDQYLNGEWTESGYIYTAGSAVTGIAASELLVRIYSTDGRFVTECYADELSRLNLHHGVYILRTPSGQCRKVFVKRNE